MTQPIYDIRLLEQFLKKVAPCPIPVLVGSLPLASHRNAEFLHNEVPGMQIPETSRERMRIAGSGPEAREEGIRIAQEALAASRPMVQGVYIMPPFGRYEAALRVLEVLG
jgi:5,10-methylenetetrahydrofolate reductase